MTTKTKTNTGLFPVPTELPKADINTGELKLKPFVDSTNATQEATNDFIAATSRMTSDIISAISDDKSYRADQLQLFKDYGGEAGKAVVEGQRLRQEIEKVESAYDDPINNEALLKNEKIQKIVSDGFQRLSLIAEVNGKDLFTANKALDMDDQADRDAQLRQILEGVGGSVFEAGKGIKFKIPGYPNGISYNELGPDQAEEKMLIRRKLDAAVIAYVSKNTDFGDKEIIQQMLLPSKERINKLYKTDLIEKNKILQQDLIAKRNKALRNDILSHQGTGNSTTLVDHLDRKRAEYIANSKDGGKSFNTKQELQGLIGSALDLVKLGKENGGITYVEFENLIKRSGPIVHQGDGKTRESIFALDPILMGSYLKQAQDAASVHKNAREQANQLKVSGLVAEIQPMLINALGTPQYAEVSQQAMQMFSKAKLPFNAYAPPSLKSLVSSEPMSSSQQTLFASLNSRAQKQEFIHPSELAGLPTYAVRIIQSNTRLKAPGTGVSWSEDIRTSFGSSIFNMKLIDQIGSGNPQQDKLNIEKEINYKLGQYYNEYLNDGTGLSAEEAWSNAKIKLGNEFGALKDKDAKIDQLKKWAIPGYDANPETQADVFTRNTKENVFHEKIKTNNSRLQNEAEIAYEGSHLFETHEKLGGLLKFLKTGDINDLPPSYHKWAKSDKFHNIEDIALGRLKALSKKMGIPEQEIKKLEEKLNNRSAQLKLVQSCRNPSEVMQAIRSSNGGEIDPKTYEGGFSRGAIKYGENENLSAYDYYGKGDANDKPLMINGQKIDKISELSIDELLIPLTEDKKDKYKNLGAFGMSEYHIRIALGEGVIKGSDKFDQATQEKLFRWAMLRKTISAQKYCGISNSITAASSENTDQGGRVISNALVIEDSK